MGRFLRLPGTILDSERKYQEMAFECLKFAEGTYNPVTQDAFIRTAEVWIALADRVAIGHCQGQPDSSQRG